jgi:uncharacterized membrane protein YozB (DUF420 family)
MAIDVPVASPDVTRHRRTREHKFYVGVGLLVLLISLAGFGPSIIEPTNRTVPLPITALVATHALASSAWILLFIAQTTLVATGRTSIHRRLGLVGLLLAIVFVVSGCLVNIGEATRGFDLSGDLVPRGADLDPSFVLAPINTFGLFAVLVGTALWYRRRPDVHKRLMVMAMLGPLVGAPIAHLTGHYPILQAGNNALGLVTGVILLSLSAIHDRISYGRIHPASLWGGIGSFAWLFGFFAVVTPNQAWRDFTSWLIQ